MSFHIIGIILLSPKTDMSCLFTSMFFDQWRGGGGYFSESVVLLFGGSYMSAKFVEVENLSLNLSLKQISVRNLTEITD